jgi:putative peptidoglycan lipid II flippase
MRIKQLTSGSSIVLLVTIFNRGTGYLRDLFMTAALGASPASQIFVFAFRVFATVRALTAESAIPTVVIDRYVRHYSGAKTANSRVFLDNEWGSWWALCALCALILTVANPFLMEMLLPHDVYSILTTGCILTFSIVFGIGLSTTSFSAVYPSLFQAQGRFFAHSALAAVPNIVSILVFLVILLLKLNDLELLAILSAFALLIAGLCQIVISRIATGQTFANIVWPFGASQPRRAHLRLARDSLTKMAPISVFNASSALASILATIILVHYNQNITYFFVAERMVCLIPGTIGYAIGVVILPMTARARYEKVGDLVQLIFLINVLLVAGCIIALVLYQFSTPIVNILYQRFKFTAGDAETASIFLEGIAVSVPPLLIEPILSSRLFGHMATWANGILVIGSMAVCGLAWVYREGLGSLAGGSHAAQACAVYVFIITSRVFLLMVLNVAVSHQITGRSSLFHRR